jgi:hypothetical protein
MADLHFIVTFRCQRRYLHGFSNEFQLTLDGAHGRPNMLAETDHETGEVVDHEPGGITSWPVPDELLEGLGWTSLEDGPRAAEHWSRLSEHRENSRAPSLPPGSETFEQMRSRIEVQCAQEHAELMRLDAATPVSMVFVDVSALHLPTQKVCHLMELAHVQRRSAWMQPGRVEFKDEPLLLRPHRGGDIHTRLGLLDRVPHVTIALERPLDGGHLMLSIGIVSRSPLEQKESRVQLRDHVHPHDRTWDELTAMACLQHALGWN